MRSLNDQVKDPSEETHFLERKAFDFICAGVGCNCLVALQESGVLQTLIDQESISCYEISLLPNPLCVQSALATLEKCQVVIQTNNQFEITEFGKSLAKHIGMITIFFNGYAKLIAAQSTIAQKPLPRPHQLVNWPAVAKASVDISKNTLTPLLLREIESLKCSGTFCDLGCGNGALLAQIYEQTGMPGLGFENSRQTVKKAKRKAPLHVAIELADITQLQGVWEDVSCVAQSFVFHDFYPHEKCLDILNSYLNYFPRMQYFFYTDIVTPSKTANDLFPGFDYVHGLLGTPTRTYEETLHVFAQSKYTILKEIAIPSLPNTFLWILCPRKTQ